MAETKLNRYRAIAIIFLISVIIITVFVAWSRYRPSQPIEILLPPEQEISGNINISGAVTNPGIYQFSGGDSIGALIQSAGGVTSNGEQDNLQLSIPAPKNQCQPRRGVAAGSPSRNRTHEVESDHRLPPAKRFLPQCRRTDKGSGH